MVSLQQTTVMFPRLSLCKATGTLTFYDWSSSVVRAMELSLSEHWVSMQTSSGICEFQSLQTKPVQMLCCGSYQMHQNLNGHIKVCTNDFCLVLLWFIWVWMLNSEARLNSAWNKPWTAYNIVVMISATKDSICWCPLLNYLPMWSESMNTTSSSLFLCPANSSSNTNAIVGISKDSIGHF